MKTEHEEQQPGPDWPQQENIIATWAADTARQAIAFFERETGLRAADGLEAKLAAKLVMRCFKSVQASDEQEGRGATLH